MLAKLSRHLAICVAGWHYNEDFYSQIANMKDADVFVVSHEPKSKTPPYLYQYIQPTHIFYEPNYGYDWGCYQQFIQKGIWQEYEFTAFMHDDICIKNTEFASVCKGLLQKHHVIGNGQVNRITSRDFAQSYAHSSWKPQSPSFSHGNVRGSFFMTTNAALQVLAKFEVYWDPFRLTSGFGNWSTRASCGKWEYLLGEDCFGFISKTYCESDYITEFIRGGQPQTRHISPIKARLIHYTTIASQQYMKYFWQRPITHQSYLQGKMIGSLLFLLSGAKETLSATPRKNA
jgi:hypothetical protein